jgi:hypothetical protein
LTESLHILLENIAEMFTIYVKEFSELLRCPLSAQVDLKVAFTILYGISLSSAFSRQNLGSLQGMNQIIEFTGISTKYASDRLVTKSELTI